MVSVGRTHWVEQDSMRMLHSGVGRWARGCPIVVV